LKPETLNFLSTLAIFAFISSCTLFNGKESESEAVARVYDNYLYKSDILNTLPKGMSYNDSVSLVKTYIDNWIRQMLTLHKAELNLTDDQKDVEKQLQDYRNSLIIYAYKKELIRQKLDTAVTHTDIENYYNNNMKNFELKDNIVRVVSVKLNKKSPGLYKIKKLYWSENEDDKTLLEEYCRQFAESYTLDDNNWILFDDLLENVPVNVYNKEQFLKYNKFIDAGDSLYRYLVYIKDYKVKNSISPLSLERENIISIILNQRKLMHLKQMEEGIFQDALAKNYFEIY